MADHFSVIGFKASSAEALSTLVSDLVRKAARSSPCAGRLSPAALDGRGAALGPYARAGRVQPDSDPDRRCWYNPFFQGERRTPNRVRAMRERPSDNLFEGTFYVELGPTIALIDVVDFARFAGKPVPFMAIAQIAAFPHELAVYENEAAFQATQADKSVKFTPRSFLASGLFVGGGSGDIVFLDPEAEDFRAPARAFLTGEVQKAERRQNPETGQEFTWALVGTAGGTHTSSPTIPSCHKPWPPA